MKTLNDYLEICKEEKGLKNDAELAKYLGMTRASLSIIKAGGGVSQKTAEKLATGAKVALEEIWLASLIQKEQNPRFKAVLENISKLSGIAASVLIACILSTNDAHAAGFKNLTSYVLCEVFRIDICS